MNINSLTPFDNLMQISQIFSDNIRLWFRWNMAADALHYLAYVLLTPLEFAIISLNTYLRSDKVLV